MPNNMIDCTKGLSTMTRPSIKAVKRLFALSKNQCAFPQCGRAIVQADGTVNGEICHIAGKSKKGPRYDPHLSQEVMHSFENLILLCEAHHKIIDGDKKTYTLEWLRGIKTMHEKDGYIELSIEDARSAELLLRSYLSIQAANQSKVMVNSPGSIQADKVTFVTRKKNFTHPPHPDSIAADLNKKNYVKYLIDRYKRFQHGDKDKVGRGKYIIIYNAIKGEFGAKWDEVPLIYFGQLIAFLQSRILRSKLGRNLNARGRKCFSSYEEWLKKPEKA
jgi:hypothetical protein